jgi:hypothetical protein
VASHMMQRAVEWEKKAIELAPNDQRARLHNNLEFFSRRREQIGANDAIAAPRHLFQPDARTVRIRAAGMDPTTLPRLEQSYLTPLRDTRLVCSGRPCIRA